MDFEELNGINIQWPWSRLILDGEKSVETRSYPIPKRYLNVELAVIETPGRCGRKHGAVPQAQIAGTVIFSASFLYRCRESWVLDFERHRVPESDIQFGYRSEMPKWGWNIHKFKKFSQPFIAPKNKGIVFTKRCQVPLARSELFSNDIFTSDFFDL
ncbi:MAG: hypothetical protein EOP48_04305 [Sphingobacteriales bacterium]|nr:MAG: hypothetical protein EOP48_04305 [Sphingobacteriales bacterium]